MKHELVGKIMTEFAALRPKGKTKKQKAQKSVL